MSQTATAPTMADNFFLEAMKPAFREDPYPFYERFRGTAPLLRVADTIWFSLGHAEVTAMLRHPRLSSDEQQHATTKAGKAPDPNRARSLVFMRASPTCVPSTFARPARVPWRMLLARISVTVGPGTSTTMMQASRYAAYSSPDI